MDYINIIKCGMTIQTKLQTNIIVFFHVESSRKIVCNQVYKYFSKNNLFYSGQYGFNKARSTEFVTIKMIDRI